jgi:hypothetical protein
MLEPRIKELCKVRKEDTNGLDVITVGWADSALFSVFEETMMDPRASHAYGAFAYRALRWKYAIFGPDA